MQVLALTVPLAVVLATAGAAYTSVSWQIDLVNEAFQGRSLAYVAAFADTARRWIAEDNVDMIDTAGELLLAGTALYVQVISEDDAIIDKRGQSAAGIALPTPGQLLIGGELKDGRLEDGSRYLDIILPSAFSVGESGTREGYVRMGLDATSLSAYAASVSVVASSVGMAFDLLLIALYFWTGKWLHARSNAQKEEDTEGKARSPVITCGALSIDQRKKEVKLANTSLTLPPKQYALIRLLTSDSSRVFSDREILEEVWPDSPLADSKDVKQQVYLLRNRLERVFPKARDIVVNVPGFGYRIASTIDRDLIRR